MTEVGCAISAVCLKEDGGGGAIVAGFPERDSGLGQRSERGAERPRKAPRFPGGPFGTAASSVEGRELIVGPGALVVREGPIFVVLGKMTFKAKRWAPVVDVCIVTDGYVLCSNPAVLGDPAGCINRRLCVGRGMTQT